MEVYITALHCFGSFLAILAILITLYYGVNRQSHPLGCRTLNCQRQSTYPRRAPKDGCLLPRKSVLVPWNAVFASKSSSRSSACQRTHKSPLARPLGLGFRPVLHLYSFQPSDQKIRYQCHVH